MHNKSLEAAEVLRDADTPEDDPSLKVAHQRDHVPVNIAQLDQIMNNDAQRDQIKHNDTQPDPAQNMTYELHDIEHSSKVVGSIVDPPT